MQMNAKQRSETHSKNSWEWVEATVWTERMLAALGNGVKGGKWFSLWDKVYSLRTLNAAWQQVAKNKGAAGVDGVSVKRFGMKAETYLQELHETLKQGTYQPQAVKRVYIPKSGGKKRPLGIPAVKDRIVQTSLKMVIEPIYEKEFLDMSYGFRPNRGAKDALREVDTLLKEGNVWVVDADIQSYFDSIPHEQLMQRVKEKISDGKILELIEKYLNQKVLEETKSWQPTQGTPQGAVLSPLLANLYLHELDVEMTSKKHKIVRYADDFVILCKSKEEAEAALARVQRWVKENGLNLHPDKTHLGDCREPGQGFEFLGYRFEKGNRWARTKSSKALREKIRAKTKRTRGVSLQQIIAELNPTLRGWFEYFKHSVKGTFKTIDGFVRRRLRAILRKREKRPGFGKNKEDHMKWPNAYFARYGLFTMKEAHAAACRSRMGNY